MADAQLRLVTVAGTMETGRSWQPRLQLFEQTTAAADRKRPILYIHGATFSSENSIFFKFGGVSWADELNKAGFSVWGLDFAGYGRSQSYPEMAADAPPAGEPLGRTPEAALQIERAVRVIIAETGALKISLIAHSWGTMAAGQFAGDHPEHVDRLVLFAPFASRESGKSTPSLDPKQYLAVLGSWRFLTMAEQKSRFVEDVPEDHPAVIAEADFPAWAELYLSFDKTSASRNPPSVKTPNGPIADVAAAWSGALPYDPSRIKAQTLIVRGEWDSLCNDADVAWLSAALTGAAQIKDVKVPEATHLVHLECGRTALYTAAAEFLGAK